MIPLEPEPVVGQWYQDSQQRYFEVVATDEESVEIQFYDGDIEEIEPETWNLLSISTASEPNDGEGPFEELDFNDYQPLADDYQQIGWQMSGELD